MRVLTRIQVVGTTLALLTTSVACSGNTTSGGSGKGGLPAGDIVLGAAIAKTGYLQPYDYTIAAVEMLIDEVNAGGGIDGHKLRLIEADTRSDPAQAVTATQKVIDEGAQILILNCEADSAAGQATIAQQAGLLNFTLCANEPGYGPPTTGRLSFVAMTSLLAESSAQALFLQSLGVKRPFLFRDTLVTYGKANCDGFQQSWEQLGGTIAGQVDFKNTDASVAVQVSELRASHADAVVMCSFPPGGAGAVKQIRDAGIDVPIIAPSAFDGTYWIKSTPDLTDFYVTLGGSSYGDPREEITSFFDRLKERGVSTDSGATLLGAYAAGQAIVDAIRATNSVDGNTLADELESWVGHELTVGPTTYSAESHAPNRPSLIFEVTGGTQEYVDTMAPEFVPTYTLGGA